MPQPATRSGALHQQDASFLAARPATASSPAAPPGSARALRRPVRPALPVPWPHFQASTPPKRSLLRSIGSSNPQNILNLCIPSISWYTDGIALHLPKAFPLSRLTQLFCASCDPVEWWFCLKTAPLSSASCTTTPNPCTRPADSAPGSHNRNSRLHTTVAPSRVHS